LNDLRTVVERLRHAAATQTTGHREFRAAAVVRLHFANLLREEMRFIALMAKSLDRQLYPGLRYQLRLPRSQSYLALIATALSFIEVLTPIKADFLERGFPPDFIEHLATLIEEINRANQTKTSALLQRTEGTVSLMQTSSRGLALVSEMHAIILRCFRHNAALLAEWEFARHVRRPNQRHATEAPARAAQEKTPTTSPESVVNQTATSAAPTSPSVAPSDVPRG
jgi:hypothetical protein